MFLVFGTLLYNEIIVLPFWGYNQYTRTALQKKKRGELLNSEKSTGAGEDIGYQAVSPHAVYDAARSQRKIA